MHGEFLEVWEETYREIWTPLLQQEGVPSDIYSALYRELYKVIGNPTGDEEFSLQLNDAIQLREAFDRVVILAGIEVERKQVDEAYEGCCAAELDNAISRKAAIMPVLATLIGEAAQTAQLLDQALRELATDPVKQAEARERALDVILNDTKVSQGAFEGIRSSKLIGERAVITFLETAFDVIEEYGGDALSNPYFNLLSEFVKKFSLRYDLRRPCTLCPTLPGMFASLIYDLRTLTVTNAHLDGLMRDFESAIRDLRTDCSDGRIKTCIQKQVNLLEAIGKRHPGITQTELGGICGQLTTWPHKAIKSSLGSLYGFASDYPGIRHGGTPENALRVIEMRDLVALSVLLAGFVPYLSDEISADEVFWRT